MPSRIRKYAQRWNGKKRKKRWGNKSNSVVKCVEKDGEEREKVWSSEKERVKERGTVKFQKEKKE